MNPDYESFLPAFNHAMLYEVGPFWNPNDPDVQAGRIDTKLQRTKVGYVNIPQDSGGETKYGVAQNSNPGISVRDLDLVGAMDVYYNDYWLKGKCNLLPYPLSFIHFDGCVNHGIPRANMFLQRAVGAHDDGVIGNKTLAAVAAADQRMTINSVSELRKNFYNQIVQRKPSQQIFLNGWLRRISEVTSYTLSKVQ